MYGVLNTTLDGTILKPSNSMKLRSTSVRIYINSYYDVWLIFCSYVISLGRAVPY